MFSQSLNVQLTESLTNEALRLNWQCKLDESIIESPRNVKIVQESLIFFGSF